MNKMTVLALLLGSVSVASAVSAKPDSSTVSEVMSYYQTGTEGPVLAQVEVCRSVATKGENKNRCVEPQDKNSLIKGERYDLWMNFLVPEGTKETIRVQFVNQGFTHKTAQLRVSGSFRFRTWTALKLSRIGAWEIGVFADNGEAIRPVTQLKVNVIDADASATESVEPMVAPSSNPLLTKPAQ